MRSKTLIWLGKNARLLVRVTVVSLRLHLANWTFFCRDDFLQNQFFILVEGMYLRLAIPRQLQFRWNVVKRCSIFECTAPHSWLLPRKLQSGSFDTIFNHAKYSSISSHFFPSRPFYRNGRHFLHNSKWKNSGPSGTTMDPEQNSECCHARKLQNSWIGFFHHPLPSPFPRPPSGSEGALTNFHGAQHNEYQRHCIYESRLLPKLEIYRYILAPQSLPSIGAIFNFHARRVCKSKRTHVSEVWLRPTLVHVVSK